MKKALLVIDIQQAFFAYTPDTAASLKAAIANINPAIAYFREQGWPVICIQHEDEAEDLLQNTAGYALPADLAIRADDLHINKRYGNAFNHTELRAHLQALGIEELILCGFCAEYCVLSTYRGALDCDLQPKLLHEGLASVTAAHIDFVRTISATTSLAELMN